MRVGELITCLQGYSPEEQVVVETDTGGEVEAYPIVEVKTANLPTERSQSEELPDPPFVVITSAETISVDKMSEEERNACFERFRDAPLNASD